MVLFLCNLPLEGVTKTELTRDMDFEEYIKKSNCYFFFSSFFFPPQKNESNGPIVGKINWKQTTPLIIPYNAVLMTQPTGE